MFQHDSHSRLRSGGAPAAHARVLIAEDSALVGAHLRTCLEREGYAVDLVPDGIAALRAALANPAPDLLVTDGDMPGIDGFELCRRIRVAGSALAIIFVTARADQVVHALDAGADDFMRKPFAPEELAARVRAALRGSRMATQLADERDRFAALVGSLQDGLMVFDADGCITRTNARLGEITGTDAGALVGVCPPFPFWPPEHADQYGEGLRRALAAGEADEADHVYRRPDGARVDVIVSVAPLAGGPTRSECVYVSTVKDVTDRRAAERALRASEARHRALADEQARLSRVAATVASSSDAEAVFSLVGREVTELLGGDAGGVSRFESDSAVLVGGWSRVDALRMRVGARLPLGGETCTSRVWREGRAVRVDDYASLHAGWLGAELDTGVRVSSIAAPVHVAGRLWGTVGSVSRRRAGFAPGAEQQLTEFAALVGVAVTGADARAELARRATTDPLTGLLNRGAFEECLADAVTGPLSLALFDLDHFKDVNDRQGHHVGDAVLRELGRRMRASSREADTLARVGGEEFVVLMPGTGLAAAVAAAERIRELVAATPFTPGGPCTISCGVAERRPGDDGPTLMLRADRALYSAKGAGRNMVAVA